MFVDMIHYAKRCFGGIAVILKNSLFTEYNISEVDKSVDGVFIFKITHLITLYKLMFVAMYLPSERSPWGRNAEEYFEHVANLIHVCSDECDVIYMCGDLNARVGLDKLTPRTVIDKTSNKHGEALT